MMQQHHQPSVLQLPWCGTGVHFSPYAAATVAVSSSQTFGLVGKGALQVVATPDNDTSSSSDRHVIDGKIELDNPIFDCKWSESQTGFLVGACGDGSLRLWDTSTNTTEKLDGHTRECHEIDWNIHKRNFVVSASWDSTARVWDIARRETTKVIRCYEGGGGGSVSVYSAVWSPSSASVFASGCSDGATNIWDINTPTARPIQSMMSATGNRANEVMSVDWDKYQPFIVVTANTDKTVRVWDIRAASVPVVSETVHRLAVRRVKCCPHRSKIFASSSYDMTVGVWDISASQTPVRVNSFESHSEFVTGIDWNLFAMGVIASTSWDRTLQIWDTGIGHTARVMQ